MQVEHQLDALHIGFAVLVEEENASIVYQNVNHQVVVLAVFEKIFGSIGLTKVGIMCDSLYAVFLCQIVGNLLQLLFLIAYQQKVGMVVASQLRCILQSYS